MKKELKEEIINLIDEIGYGTHKTIPDFLARRAKILRELINNEDRKGTNLQEVCEHDWRWFGPMFSTYKRCNLCGKEIIN